MDVQVEIARPANRIPDNEFTTDLEYQATMDSAWHHWMQPCWDREREAWLRQQEERDRASGKMNTPRLEVPK